MHGEIRGCHIPREGRIFGIQIPRISGYPRIFGIQIPRISGYPRIFGYSIPRIFGIQKPNILGISPRGYHKVGESDFL